MINPNVISTIDILRSKDIFYNQNQRYRVFHDKDGTPGMIAVIQDNRIEEIVIEEEGVFTVYVQSGYQVYDIYHVFQSGKSRYLSRSTIEEFEPA